MKRTALGPESEEREWPGTVKLPSGDRQYPSGVLVPDPSENRSCIGLRPEQPCKSTWNRLVLEDGQGEVTAVVPVCDRCKPHISDYVAARNAARRQVAPSPVPARPAPVVRVVRIGAVQAASLLQAATVPDVTALRTGGRPGSAAVSARSAGSLVERIAELLGEDAPPGPDPR